MDMSVYHEDFWTLPRIEQLALIRKELGTNDPYLAHARKMMEHLEACEDIFWQFYAMVCNIKAMKDEVEASKDEVEAAKDELKTLKKMFDLYD